MLTSPEQSFQKNLIYLIRFVSCDFSRFLFLEKEGSPLVVTSYMIDFKLFFIFLLKNHKYILLKINFDENTVTRLSKRIINQEPRFLTRGS